MRWAVGLGCAVLVWLVAFFVVSVREEWGRLTASAPPRPHAALPMRAPSLVPAQRLPPAPAAIASAPDAAPADEKAAWCAAVPAGDDALQEPIRQAYGSAIAALAAAGDARSAAAAQFIALFDAGRAATPEALVRHAARSTDPFVYALAHQACSELGSQFPRGSCQLISAAQWARLDPGNAVPWLAVAAEAAGDRDGDAEREALYRVALAKRHDSHLGTLSALVLARLPPGPPSPEQAGLNAMLYEVETARRRPSHAVLDRYCAEEAVRDANRRQVCAGIAGLLRSEGDSLAARRAGLTLGLRTGEIAAEAQQAELQGLDALNQALRSELPPSAALKCSSLPALADFLRQLRAGGEVAAARAALARSGAASSSR